MEGLLAIELRGFYRVVAHREGSFVANLSGEAFLSAVARCKPGKLAQLKAQAPKMGTLQRQTTLSKQASAVFNLTLDQLQQSVGSGKPFGSMNMVSALPRDASWDHMHGAPMLLGAPVGTAWGPTWRKGRCRSQCQPFSPWWSQVVGLHGETRGSHHFLGT